MKVLAFETSCDETSCAVTSDREVLSLYTISQIDRHEIFGGVVPEIASRLHVECIVNLTRKALERANLDWRGIDGIAVTFAPGLIGALLVGVNFAKGVALALKKPLIPVHHIRAHIAANYIASPGLKPPFLALVVSGGHTQIVGVRDYTKFEIIGKTRDDAAGECFDKAARALGLPYPGGVHLDRLAEKGNAGNIRLPTPRVENSPYDFSFSGLKTAMVNLIHNAKQKDETVCSADVAAALRAKVAEILTGRTLLAAENFGYDTVVLAGGVSANSELRRRMKEECESRGISLHIPPVELCGDNAAMVGVQAGYEYAAGNMADMSLNAAATLPIDYV